ncbi:N-acetyltransferase [Synechococcus sp. RSCCF101]|uniref:N-acetyltransferase n=1 Tax=Synechococcus sp. RSCCF101 TaxID=2511069 RepID=UPI0012489AF4|nr:N-acetyltransferase [Synechococcus sp. RSCCF101]QEY32154.1 N-acetyltransferase [Synechococcus sp. RSCCF101]
MIFRVLAPPPALPAPFRLEGETPPEPAELNALLVACGDPDRAGERLARAMAASDWWLSIRDEQEHLAGYVRATSDRALNANLWNLAVEPSLSGRRDLMAVLLHRALTHMRRERAGCSISLSAPPEALETLRSLGFVVDPGGIRAMGLQLRDPARN